MERKTYIEPQLTLIEVSSEQGFAASSVESGVEGFDREDWDE